MDRDDEFKKHAKCFVPFLISFIFYSLALCRVSQLEIFDSVSFSFFFSVFSIVFCVLYSFISLSVFASFHTLFSVIIVFISDFLWISFVFFLPSFFFFSFVIPVHHFVLFSVFTFFSISVTYSRCSIIVCRVAIVVISENFSYYSNNSY